MIYLPVMVYSCGWDQGCRSVQLTSFSSGFSCSNISLYPTLVCETSLELGLRTEGSWQNSHFVQLSKANWLVTKADPSFSSNLAQEPSSDLASCPNHASFLKVRNEVRHAHWSVTQMESQDAVPVLTWNQKCSCVCPFRCNQGWRCWHNFFSCLSLFPACNFLGAELTFSVWTRGGNSEKYVLCLFHGLSISR